MISGSIIYSHVIQWHVYVTFKFKHGKYEVLIIYTVEFDNTFLSLYLLYILDMQPTLCYFLLKFNHIIVTNHPVGSEFQQKYCMGWVEEKFFQIHLYTR